MTHLEAEKLKKDPSIYKKIGHTKSWILRERFIFRFFDGITREASILDIGCANGYFLDKLKEMGFKNLYGVDIANYLKNKYYPHESVDINIESLPHKNNFFDVVTAFQVIEHLENYFLIMREARRVLKKGGHFIFSVPNQFNIAYRIKFALTGNVTGWTYANNHLLFLTRDVFRKTYLKYFDLVETHYGRGPVPGLGRLNIIPGLKIPSRVRVLPRSEYFADRACYILRKK